MGGTKNKIRRYTNLIKKFSNWNGYIWHKTLGLKKPFTFKQRNSFDITVPSNMFSSFKESFFDEIYFKQIPEELLNRKIKTVIDIGGNVGYFSLFVFSKYPNASVYVFEPMPFNFKLLLGYKNHYPEFDLHIFEKAVSNTNSSIILNASSVDEYTTMASVLNQNKNAVQIEVDCITLETVISDNKLHEIDILKLDCEGSEFAILYNLPPDDLNKIKIMSIETHDGEKEGENHHALVNFLHENNFETKDYHKNKNGYIWAWRKD